MKTCTRIPTGLKRWTQLISLVVVICEAGAVADMCQFSNYASDATSIYMTSCSLTTLDPADLTRFTKLQTLVLETNNLTTFPDLSPLASTLRFLSLDYNQISHMSNNSDQNLKNLESLTMTYNKWSSFPNLTQIGGSALKILYVGNNQITDISSDLLLPMISLEWIGLSSNSFTSVPDFSPLSSSLTNLNFRRNPIREISHGTFSTLVNLEKLFLDHCANLTHFSHPVDDLKHISVLKIRNTGLSLLPPIINDNIANLDLDLRESVDVCRCENAWLKQESPKMLNFQYDDKDCDGDRWSNNTVDDMNTKCARERNQTKMSFHHAKAVKTLMSLKPFLLHSYEPMSKKIYCIVKCLDTPGCVSFYWRRGDCVLMAPGNSISVSSVPGGNLEEWIYFALT